VTHLRYAVRTLRRSPWYTATTIGVLGISMALATVVFAIVDGVLVKPLSLPQPSELFLVRADVTNTKGAVTTDRVQAPPVSGIEIDAWREAIPEIPLTAVSTPFRFKRTDGREYWAANVDAQFFDVMGLRPLAGGFVPEDYDWDQRDRGRAIRPLLVSHRYWQQVLGGDPGVIGRTVDRWERDGITWGERIAGVLPRDFVFPVDPEEPQPELVSPMPRRPGLNVDYQVVLRLRQSADLPRVRDRLLVGLRQAAAAAPPASHQRHSPFDTARLVPLAEQLARYEKPAFVLLFSGAALLLLLGCLNVAGLAAVGALIPSMRAARVDPVEALRSE